MPLIRKIQMHITIKHYKQKCKDLSDHQPQLLASDFADLFFTELPRLLDSSGILGLIDQRQLPGLYVDQYTLE